MNDAVATSFDSFGVEYMPEEVKTFIGNKNIKQIYTELFFYL